MKTATSIISLLVMALNCTLVHAQKKTCLIDSAVCKQYMEENIRLDDHSRSYMRKIKVSDDSSEHYTFKKADNSLKLAQVFGPQHRNAKGGFIIYCYHHEKLYRIITAFASNRILGRLSSNYYLFKDGKLFYKEESNAPDDAEDLARLAEIYLQKSKTVQQLRPVYDF